MKRISKALNSFRKKFILYIIKIMEKIIRYLKNVLDAEENKVEEDSNESEKFTSTFDKQIYKDSILKPNEKYYLMCLITSINMNNNCIEISLTNLMQLFNCKKKSQVTTKLKDLEEKGVIKKISGGTNEVNKYIILKYVQNSIRNEKVEVEDDKEDSRKGTSDSFDTGIEALDIINKNITHYKKGIDINIKYINDILNSRDK